MKNNKIVHIITGLNNGGAEAVLFRLCVNDLCSKHVVISLMDLGKYGPLLLEKGVDVYYLNMPQGKVTLKGLIKLFKLLKKLKPDVVQTWMYHADLIGGVMARLAGINNVFWNIRHTSLEKGTTKSSTIYIAKLCALLSYIVPKKIVCCANTASIVHADLGYNKNKIHVVSNGYKLDQLIVSESDALKIKLEFQLNNTSNILGMVGRYDPLKDHSNLLQALSILKKQNIEFKCLLVGSFMSSDNKILVNEIVRLNLSENILLLGQRSDIPAIMNSLDIHVLSSLSEAFPNVLAEAMACGTPCVTTDVGDASLIIGHTGWVVSTKDSQALADAISFAYHEKQNDKQAWSLRKESARNRIVENFSIEKMIIGYRKVWFSK